MPDTLSPNPGNRISRKGFGYRLLPLPSGEGIEGRGGLRPLDRAFANFLHNEGGETDEAVLMLVALTSQQLGQGHICLDLEKALGDPEALFPPEDEDDPGGPAQWLAEQNASDLKKKLKASAVIDEGPGNAPLVFDGERLYLRRYWQYEQTVAEEIASRLNSTLAPPEQLPALLEKLFPEEDRRSTPDWQKIACALATRSALTLITGGPGTGKTTTVVRLLGLLQAAALEGGSEKDKPLRIRLAAPTGKAAARLGESIGDAVDKLPVAEEVRKRIPTEVLTLHKLLGRRPDSRHFRHHRHNPLHADLVVVDEASMIDLEMTASLLDALRPNTRLILLGDKDQLASVEAGAVMGDLCRDADQGDYDEDTVQWISNTCGEDISEVAGQGGPLARQTAMLRHSHRFGADSGIGALARAINDGDADEVNKAWPKFDDIERLDLNGLDDNRLEAHGLAGYRPYLKVLEKERPEPGQDPEPWAEAVLDAFAEFQLLCALRRGPAGVDGLNRRIANTLHGEGLIARTEGWYEGRPVMVTRNDYGLGLMNGDLGITLRLPASEGPGSLRVAFRLPDKSLKLVLPSRLDAVETVYAMTVHKSQGSEFDHTSLVLPETDNPVVSRELLYTAVTRARKRSSLLLPRERVLREALGRRTWRASGLKGLL